MNLSHPTFDPHRLVGILIALGGLLAGIALFALSYTILNREYGGSFSVFEMKGIAALCFGFSAAVAVLAYYGCIEE